MALPLFKQTSIFIFIKNGILWKREVRYGWFSQMENLNFKSSEIICYQAFPCH